MRTLLWDCETAPSVADVWSLHNVNIGLPQLREASFMMCWSAKWLGERKTHFRSVFHDGRDEMLAGIHQLMTDADVVVTYNGLRFDLPTLNKEFLLGGFPPPAPSRQLDLYQVVRRHFKFPSGKLQYVSTALGLDGKVSHEGHSLWTKCLAGDKEAWKRMKRYSIQDTVLLEELHDKLRPWIWNGPNRQLYGAGGDTCPSCGSDSLGREGFATLAAGRYQRFKCRDCGSWSRSSRRESSVTLQGVNPR